MAGGQRNDVSQTTHLTETGLSAHPPAIRHIDGGRRLQSSCQTPPMDPGPVRDLLTVALGVLTGALSGLFGVGGAVISTPGIRALGATALVAVGTTLPSIIPGAASGTARYLREHLIDWRVVRWTAPAGIVASVFGSLLSRVVPGEGHLLMLLTAALLGWSAVRTYRSPPEAGPVEAAAPGADPAAVDADADPAADVAVTGGNVPPPETAPADARPGPYVAVGIVAGLLSGLLGVGGGIVMVPGFTQVGKMGIKAAIATSLACVALFAIPGTITHALLGDIDWRFALLLAAGVIPGARLGATLAIRASDRRMRTIVAAFLGLTSIIYASGEVAALFG
jgi:uncharacterized membrane protein YfcA